MGRRLHFGDKVVFPSLAMFASFAAGIVTSAYSAAAGMLPVWESHTGRNYTLSSLEKKTQDVKTELKGDIHGLMTKRAFWIPVPWCLLEPR